MSVTVYKHGRHWSQADLDELQATLKAAEERSKSHQIRIGDTTSAGSTWRNYINIPPAVVKDIIARHNQQPDDYVVLFASGEVSHNYINDKDVINAPLLTGFK